MTGHEQTSTSGFFLFLLVFRLVFLLACSFNIGYVRTADRTCGTVDWTCKGLQEIGFKGADRVIENRMSLNNSTATETRPPQKTFDFSSDSLQAWLFGTVWHCLALFGTVWHCLVLFGTVWHCLALFGTVWHCLALFGTVWHCLALFGTVCCFDHVRVMRTFQTSSQGDLKQSANKHYPVKYKNKES